MFLAHAPISFLANEWIQKKSLSKLKSNERIIIGIAAFLFGLLPDVDILILLATTTPTFMHHTLISHTPIFYICLWLFLKLFFLILNKWFNKPTKKFFNPEFTNILINTFLIATLFHLFADYFAEDIMLFYPFSTQNYSMFKYILEPNLFGGYFYNVQFGVEAVFVSIFFVYIFNILFKHTKWLKAVNISMLSLAGLFFGFSLFAHFNTYNKSILKDSNENSNYDIDYDSLSDGLDMDVDNDGKDNILDIELKHLVSQVEAIIDSKKWAADPEDHTLWGKIKMEYGGISSYRLISQAYWNLHSPISPVLKNMLNQDGTLSGYSWDFDSKDTFYKYFNDKNMLIDLDTNSTPTLPQGAIFFILDNEKKVQNLGIILTNDKVGIVLPYDNVLTYHSFSDVTNYYSSNETFVITK